MPKLSTRTILTVLISLGAVLAIFTSVQGASVNLNHDRLSVAELEAYNAQLDAYNNSSYHNGGGGCQSESRTNPNDY